MRFDLTKCKRDENGHLLAQTRDGRKVRIICTDAACGFPIIGLMHDAGEGQEIIRTWRANGAWNDITGGYPLDLANPPVQCEAIVEVWRSPSGEIDVASVGSFDVSWREKNGWRKVNEQTITWSE